MVQKQELKQNWMKGYDVVIGEDVETKIATDFSALLDSSVSKNFEEGEVFMGNIINIGQDYVTVDIGYKQEGLVSVKEFQNYDGSLKI
ncbi:MAG: S1 RNA-binding domain-containing protein, partial [Bacteriovorax sp.]|nr:S1 RNA-binding domain-containing protein [Bacteriovorax sp.]